MVVASVSIHEASASPLNPEVHATFPADITGWVIADTTEARASVKMRAETGSGVSDTFQATSLIKFRGEITNSSTTIDGARRGYPDFAIAGGRFSEHGNIIQDSYERKRKFDEIEVKWSADIEDVKSLLRPLNEYAGKYETIEQQNGGYINIDVSPGNNNTYDLIPPDNFSPPMRRKTVLIKDYKEKLKSAGTAYDITIKFAPDTEDELDGNEVDESRSGRGGEWKFSLSDSTIVTNHVTVDSKSKITNAVKGFTLNLILSDKQTETLQNNVSKVGAIDVWNIDEGVNKTVDNNPDDRNTVYIEPPSQDFFNHGYYGISDWQYEYIGQRYYEVKIDLLSYPDTGTVTMGETANAIPGTYMKSWKTGPCIQTAEGIVLQPDSIEGFGEIISGSGEITNASGQGQRPDLRINTK